MSVSDNGHSAARVGFDLTDVEKEAFETSQWVRWRNDRYTETVRAITSAWGKPLLIDGEYPTAQWDLPTKARVKITKHRKFLSASFITPQAAEVDRSLGY
ncbi:MAG: DUF6301 family protein [Dermatophilaceae bacterium]